MDIESWFKCITTCYSGDNRNITSIYKEILKLFLCPAWILVYFFMFFIYLFVFLVFFCLLFFFLQTFGALYLSIFIFNLLKTHYYLAYHVFCILSQLSRGNILIRNFSNCSDSVKIQLFKTYCSGFFCAHLWNNCTIESRRRLKVAYNRIFRTLLNLNYDVSMSESFIHYNVLHSDIIVRKSIYGFMSRINTSENGIINTLVNSLFYVNCSMFQCWDKLLFI